MAKQHLGDLLVEEQLITQAELEAAIAKQRTSQTDKRLGDVLVDMGYISSDELLKFLGKQMDFASIDSTIDKKKINNQLITVLVIQAVILVGLLGMYFFIRAFLFKEIEFLTDDDVVTYLSFFVLIAVILFTFSSITIQGIFKINKRKAM